MQIAGVEIDDTFAEAFPMTGCRVMVTAATARWAETAARVATGYGTSVIACDAEAGVEAWLPPSATPDGRPGAALLFFSFSRDGLQKAVVGRVGQCIMTCPTTACFNGLSDPVSLEKPVALADQLRYFGDGQQISKRLGARRYWRIPVMDGEFLCEDRLGTRRGVAGGNFLLLGRDSAATLEAAEAAVAAIQTLPEVICPFPGGVVRSGSKVGSKYSKLRASTNHDFCPTLRGVGGGAALGPEVSCVYEIVIDGLSAEAVRAAMAMGIRAACEAAAPSLVRISAGNYGGNLGPHHLRLHDVLTAAG